MHGHVRSSIPYRPGITQTANDGSSTEDFRSVIDDLTVANKKLRQKLKKYEKQYDAHLQEEKLFEVRFHGLPDHKKAELEATLRKFATGLDGSTNSEYRQISYAPALEHQKTASSASRFAESGYASLSASGQNSSTPSNQASNQTEDRQKMSRSVYNRQQQSIQSYLHDIPAGLRPNSHAPMTDKSKKKLVVRRLEQIFAGKRSAPGTHPQPMQQEEVAQSAASADRQEREATGLRFKPEGLRVARIMDRGDKEEFSGQTRDQRLQTTLQSDEQDMTGAGSPNQRPTRPLDLDLYRAQVPVENMEYIRHLGFSPPDMDTGEAPEEGHGWLYLNLLINMAQLHTLNVTPDFVKDALHEYSSHLELSRDGRKIRWKGGLDVTKNSSDSSSENYSGNSPLDNALDAQIPPERPKTERNSSNEGLGLGPEVQAKRLARAKREFEQKQFAYTPIFFHKESSEEDEDYYGLDNESSGNSLQPPQPAADSSGFGSSAMQSGSSTKKRKHENGPMIFYNKAQFCTDLSGDRLGASLTAPGAYSTITNHPIGATASPSRVVFDRCDVAELRGPLDNTPMEIDSSNGSRIASSDEDIDFSPQALDLGTGDGSPVSIDFEASGVGGVQPEDNFSIHVRRAHTQVTTPNVTGCRRSSLYSKKILDVLNEAVATKDEPASPSSPSRVIKEEIISASRQSLPNSTLPPASFLPLDSTSSGDVDSDLGSDESLSDEETESDNGPATTMQLLNISPNPDRHFRNGSSESSEAESEYSDDSDDGSVDLLATARQLEPNVVRNQEREYDAALADRLAEEIVAGSSAATAGGGSGFNTPAVPEVENGENALREGGHSMTSVSMSSRSKLKRTRTNDSIAIKGKKSKSQNKE